MNKHLRLFIQGFVDGLFRTVGSILGILVAILLIYWSTPMNYWENLAREFGRIVKAFAEGVQ